MILFGNDMDISIQTGNGIDIKVGKNREILRSRANDPANHNFALSIFSMYRNVRRFLSTHGAGFPATYN
jgi:hypothetical protein